jgi:hypothetical protein
VWRAATRAAAERELGDDDGGGVLFCCERGVDCCGEASGFSMRHLIFLSPAPRAKLEPPSTFSANHSTRIGSG